MQRDVLSIAKIDWSTLSPDLLYWFALVGGGVAFILLLLRSLSWIKTPREVIGVLQRNSSIVVFMVALISRIVLILISMLIVSYFETHSFWGQAKIPPDSFYNRMVQWDAMHYLKITQQGYSALYPDYLHLVFYPLFPNLTRALSLLVGSEFWSALIISNVSFALSAVVLNKWVTQEFSAKIAKRAVIFLCLSPFGIFFSVPFTESLFLLLSLLCLYNMRKQRWELMGMFGLLACLTRTQGLLLLIPALFFTILAWRSYTQSKKAPVGRLQISPSPLRTLWTFVIPCGFVLYLVVNLYITGNMFSFLTYQKDNWNQTLDFFPKNLETIFYWIFANPLHKLENLSTALVWIFPQTLSFLIGLWASLYLLIKRIHPIWGMYLLIYLIFSYSPSWLLSGTRYMLCAAPIYVALALFTQNKWISYPLYALSGLLLLIYSVAYCSGIFSMM